MKQRRRIQFIIIVLAAFSIYYWARPGRTTAAAVANEQAFQPLGQVLVTIPSGRSALAVLDRYQDKVTFEAGQGTFFLASVNIIVIDSAHAPLRAALSFVHEAHHASVWHQGLRVDISTLDEAAYAHGRVEEEAVGVVKSIEAKLELAALGLDVSGLSYPLEDAYRQAADQARTAARIRDGQLSQSELDGIVCAAGTAAVVDGFLIGRVRTSHTRESYLDFYGQCWTKANVVQTLLTPLSEFVYQTVGYDLVAAAISAVSASC